jgi:hypothetical protein
MKSVADRSRRAVRKRLRSRRYGLTAHTNLRAALAPAVASGTVRCTRAAACKFAEEVDGRLIGGIIEPGTAWDLGHDDRDPRFHTGPEHASCNRAAPNRNKTSRQW